MQLYVKNSYGQKIHLNLLASTREELYNYIGSPYFNLLGNVYHINHVYAESSEDNTSTGLIVGGLIGILGGPLGVVVGGVLGGAFGNNSDNSERARVNTFNNSRI